MRKSKVYSFNKEDLENLIKISISFADVLRALNLDISSGNYRSLKNRLLKENISYEHIQNGINFHKKKLPPRTKMPLTEILVENSFYNPTCLKERLIKNQLLMLKCNICNLEPIWNNVYLCLQLDHINGISTDNRLENLRLLCPNCHSQTNTYAARNKKPKPKKEIIKIPYIKPTKINWPSDEELMLMIKNHNCVKVAKQLGVSDTAIKKRLERRGFKIGKAGKI